MIILGVFLELKTFKQNVGDINTIYWSTTGMFLHSSVIVPLRKTALTKHFVIDLLIKPLMQRAKCKFLIAMSNSKSGRLSKTCPFVLCWLHHPQMSSIIQQSLFLEQGEQHKYSPVLAGVIIRDSFPGFKRGLLCLLWRHTSLVES